MKYSVIIVKWIIILCIATFPLPVTNATASYCDSTYPYTYFFKETESLSKWEELKDLYIKYKGCDDGVFAEGFSDRIEWLFQNRYVEFFKTEIYKDKDFYEFIKRHIDETWADGSEKSLKLQLENYCPKGNESICADLIRIIERDSKK
jgi:hypothetical protein